MTNMINTIYFSAKYFSRIFCCRGFNCVTLFRDYN